MLYVYTVYFLCQSSEVQSIKNIGIQHPALGTQT